MWRPLTLDDAPAVAALLNAAEAVDLNGEHYDADDARQELADPYTDLEHASLGAFDGDVLAGYVTASYKKTVTDEHRVGLSGVVHPSHRRRGIGATLLKAGVGFAQHVHALHHPAVPLIVDAHAGDQITGATALFRSQGFEPVRYYQHMEHPLGAAIPDSPLPDGLRVETWTPGTDHEFLRVRNESFEDHWGSNPMPADAWSSKITAHNFRPTLSFLLRDTASGSLAGMLVTMYWEADTVATGTRDAYFMFIGTLRPYRKRGVAGFLIAHALRAAEAEGYGRASLGVDAANPTGAFGLYEKAGFTPKQRFVRWSLSA